MFRWLALTVFVAALSISARLRARARRDTGTIQRSQESRALIVGRLAVALPTLATYCLALEDYDRAFKYASMGLSAHQSIKTYREDRYDPATIEAGDFHCRLTRGQVLMHRSSFAEAMHELDEAKILVDVGHIQGAHAKSVLDQAYAHLRTLIRKRDESVRDGHPDDPQDPEVLDGRTGGVD